MDACTSSMCDKAWGRPGFAKVLVEIWAIGELKREIEFNGRGGFKVMVKVEYLWEPSQCAHCLVFGHKTSSCAKAVANQHKQKRKEKVDADGFVMVEKRQWKPKVSDKPSSSGVIKEVAITTLVEKNVEHIITNLENSNVEEPVESSNLVDEVTNVATVEVLGSKDISSEPIVEHVELNIPKHTVSVDVSDPDRGKAVQIPKQARSFVKPLDTPIRSILKNPNRFSALGQDSVMGKEVSAKDVSGKKAHLRGLVEVGYLSHGLMVKLLTWNIRGLNTSLKQLEVRDLIKDRGINICALLETHVRSDALMNVMSKVFGRWPWVSNHMHCEFGTRILIGWNDALFDLMVLDMTDQVVNCEIKVRGNSTVFFFSFIYAANQGRERRNLWSAIRKFRAIIGDKPWVLSGDFNTLLFPHDALGGCSRRNLDMAEFASFVEDIHGDSCQKPKEEAGLKRKLDRVMSNTSFTSEFVNASVNFLPRGISDHSPSLLSFTCGAKKRRPGFKFDNFLIENPRFKQIVNDIWNIHIDGNFMFRVTARLKLLKKPLANLRNTYGDLSLRVKKLKQELDVIQLACDLDHSNLALRDDLISLRLAYSQARQDEELAAMQRAKVKWLRDGDSNTRFFFFFEGKTRQFYKATKKIKETTASKGTGYKRKPTPNQTTELTTKTDTAQST
ncbi:LOW QUALITY PROTEIN: hypothetical protein OSB04_006683 [Centaurea solstitialis]|uniref:Endonuclease/exonuclease/phosphatase domain-containing protein n=1 Tax=Centaurea solstitialis TaxID=347529 RepID=A0AA38TID7_9ASTR|nr:LOW QUALITY PROTEIN: hypothetical protein OSB04_006683 [Centaurea solstitialis]